MGKVLALSYPALARPLEYFAWSCSSPNPRGLQSGGPQAGLSTR